MQLVKNIGVAMLLSCSFSTYAAFNVSPPASGPLDDGGPSYRNLFTEIGKPQSRIDNKVNSAVNAMFGNDSNKRLYYTNGVSSNEAYIKQIDTNEVRSEGQSWGMTVVVMAGKKLNSINFGDSFITE